MGDASLQKNSEFLGKKKKKDYGVEELWRIILCKFNSELLFDMSFIHSVKALSPYVKIKNSSLEVGEKKGEKYRDALTHH